MTPFGYVLVVTSFSFVIGISDSSIPWPELMAPWGGLRFALAETSALGDGWRVQYGAATCPETPAAGALRPATAGRASGRARLVRPSRAQSRRPADRRGGLGRWRPLLQ